MKSNIVYSTLLLLLLLFSVTACTTKTQSISHTQVDDIKPLTNDNDTFSDDEFDDEFALEETEVFDPLEGYNRWMTSVNDMFYVYVFDPVSQGYAFLLPQPVRVGVSNTFHNLKFPIRFSNTLLQLKFNASMRELGRFMVNSTVGVFGFFDVAKGLKPQEEDFGQTLGYYGVGSGFHIVLPFFGPSNLRDTLGLSVDTFVSPLSDSALPYQIPDSMEEAFVLSSVYYVNKNSLHLGEYQSLKRDALDTYTFFRDNYEQKRIKEIEN
jgi:phospholipid-binding lipoprotein MlaA